MAQRPGLAHGQCDHARNTVVQSCIPTSALPRGSAFAINEAHREDSGADQRASGSQPLRCVPSPTAKNPRHHSLHCLLVDDLRATCLTFQCNCPQISTRFRCLVITTSSQAGRGIEDNSVHGTSGKVPRRGCGSREMLVSYLPWPLSHTAMLMVSSSNDTVS